MTSAPARRLAISNIAWDSLENDAVAAVMLRCGATGVEIAPTKWRDDPLDASPAEVIAYRRSWEDHGLSIVSLQSLLFGRADLQLFGNDATRSALIDYLRRTIDLAAALGARCLVFGSPKNRLRGALPLADALAVAHDVLRPLGEYAHERGAALCIEANPPAYGCDFITTTAEATELCQSIDHPGVRVNGDLGGMTMAGEPPGAAVQQAGQYLAHFHASEPNLVELGAVTGDLAADHAGAGAALSAANYSGWVSVEMRRAADGANIAAVERALRRARELYG